MTTELSSLHVSLRARHRYKIETSKFEKTITIEIELNEMGKLN